MDLRLLSIQFRDVPRGSLFVIPLRRGPDGGPRPVPEWTLDQPNAAVAWRLDLIGGGPVQVELRFQSGLSQDFEIKAEDSSGSNLSGSIPPFCIRTTAHLPSAIVVTLSAPRLTKRTKQEIDTRDDRWEWFAREPGSGAWTRLLQTTHRAYTALGKPAPPWSIHSADAFVWTDVLDFACKWAAGAKSLATACEKITRAVFDLGSWRERHRLIYKGWSSYTSVLPNAFNCIDLIQYLKTGAPPNVPFVDCHDTACAVSTFANALGAELIQGTLARRNKTFCTNSVVVIGGKEGKNEFDEHEVAWGGTATVLDPVWDGCLLVDGDSDPSSPPHRFSIAAGTAFTNPNDIGYRERLVVPGQAGQVHAPGPKKTKDNFSLRPRFPRPRHTPRQGPGMVAPVDLNMFLGTVQLTPWNVYEWYVDQPAPDVVLYLSSVTLAGDGSDPRALVEWYRCASVGRATDVLKQVRTLYSVPPVNLDKPGQAGFSMPDGSSTVFLRGNVVIRVTQASFDAGPLAVLPEIIDNALETAFGGQALIS